MATFFSSINQKLREKKLSLKLVHFDEAVRNEIAIEKSTNIASLDYFGCYGKGTPKTYLKMENAT
jgi:hypothetical protein